MNNHYAVLGVRPDASPQEIEAAFRRVALERGYEYGSWRELQDAYDVLRDPERVQVNPDCGLRTRSWDVVYEKLANMVQGTRLAEEVLNRSSAVAGGI